MAAVVRLKRKRFHDPADTLLLSCKRKRSGGFIDEQQIYRRAGTLNSPTTSLSSTIDLDSISTDTLSPLKSSAIAIGTSRKRNIKLVNLQNFEDNEASSSTSKSVRRIYDAVLDDSPQKVEDPANEAIACNGEAMTVTRDLMLPQPSRSGTELDELMATNSTQHDSSLEDEFVYDIFYLEGDSEGFDHSLLEDILCVEAFGEDYTTFKEYRDNRVFEDDDDDSNDEDNWRNDYPDEEEGDSDDDGDEYRPGDEYAGTGYLDLNLDRTFRLASDEDLDSDGDEDDEDMDRLLDDFVSQDREFNRSYLAYRKHCQQQRQDADDDSD